MSVRLALAVVLAAGPVAAVEPTLDLRSIDEALAIGQSRMESQHTRFHAPYRIAVGRPPVDYIDVVTPFRRVVLAAESRIRQGDRSFGQRQALDAVGLRGQIELFVELTFHPLNTFVGVPAYSVELVTGTARMPPRTFDLIPRFGPRVDGAPPAAVTGPLPPAGSQPMLGGTVLAGFDGTLLNPTGTYAVVIRESGKDVASATLALATLR